MCENVQQKLGHTNIVKEVVVCHLIMGSMCNKGLCVILLVYYGFFIKGILWSNPGAIDGSHCRFDKKGV